MDSPLGPLFASAFMTWFEKTYMQGLIERGVIRWHRYVDDMFAIVRSRKHAEAILGYLNSLHNNIKFTIEYESNDKHVLSSNGHKMRRQLHNVHVQEANIHRRLPELDKPDSDPLRPLGLIRCLAERIWRICSEQEDQLKEIEKLKQILHKNDYPVDVVDFYSLFFVLF